MGGGLIKLNSNTSNQQTISYRQTVQFCVYVVYELTLQCGKSLKIEDITRIIWKKRLRELSLKPNKCQRMVYADFEHVKSVDEKDTHDLRNLTLRKSFSVLTVFQYETSLWVNIVV
ncbi:hypothetical protein CDAR_78891 [Caerostris darwini]|uniref:Uncharacterized protein n=1 Tax=Caerostris darwini TaxID=1538125 RepID=A0AAV4Q282_9ARAC|nr:hypothetical protein CDAR_78891 [Caerostris darwini]